MSKAQTLTYVPHEVHLAIPCCLCGRRLHCLGKHLAMVHGITGEEYRQQFPGAPLVSDHFRAVSGDLYLDRFGTLGTWTRERIIKAIQVWAETHGRPPRQKDWNRRARWKRDAMGPTPCYVMHPTSGMVAAVFGSFGAGLGAAGFPAPPRGMAPGTKMRKRHCRNGHRYRPEDRQPDGTYRCGRCQLKDRPTVVVTCPDCGQTRTLQARVNNAPSSNGEKLCRSCATKRKKRRRTAGLGPGSWRP